MSNFLSAAENAARQRQNDTCPVNLLTLWANDLYFKTGMSDFATAALLERIELHKTRFTPGHFL